MEIIEPSYTIMTQLHADEVYNQLECCGRTAYKSEDRITEVSAVIFLHNILRRGHESVLEHVNITVRFICDRGVTHELVRHRLVAYTQESTRYCDYSRKGMQFIKPVFWNKDSAEYAVWLSSMEQAEKTYNILMNDSYNCTPQEARSVLPNSLKTEIVCTANIREWRHILRLRTAPSAHPQMRQLMIPLLEDFKTWLPILFEDIPLPDNHKNIKSLE